VSAGEALPDADAPAVREATGIEIIDGIGSTEMIHIFISLAARGVRRGATGRVRARLPRDSRRPGGQPLPPGTIGRLAVKGPTGCRYLDDERQESYVRDGWNVTGDAYRMDEDGYFFYQARPTT
jgi:2-aminobenzoate-CoA ligase